MINNASFTPPHLADGHIGLSLATFMQVLTPPSPRGVADIFRTLGVISEQALASPRSVSTTPSPCR